MLAVWICKQTLFTIRLLHHSWACWPVALPQPVQIWLMWAPFSNVVIRAFPIIIISSSSIVNLQRWNRIYFDLLSFLRWIFVFLFLAASSMMPMAAGWWCNVFVSKYQGLMDTCFATKRIAKKINVDMRHASPFSLPITPFIRKQLRKHSIRTHISVIMNYLSTI